MPIRVNVIVAAGNLVDLTNNAAPSLRPFGHRDVRSNHDDQRGARGTRRETGLFCEFRTSQEPVLRQVLHEPIGR